MTRFIEGLDRSQTCLLPACIDDYVEDHNPVRAIDAFIDMLDLAELGFDVVPEATGRPGYHPATMLKLYLYGYLNQVQSSRRLERECARNLELIWLTGQLKPDFKTIADFRRDNGVAIPEVRLSRAMKKLAHYRKEADNLRAIEHRMDSTGETQVSLTDPDCRAMATTSKQPRVVGYNVQSAVETKHHLIVAHEVTNHGYDRDALAMMATAAQEAMPGEIEAIADKGYYKGEEIVACEQAGI